MNKVFQLYKRETEPFRINWFTRMNQIFLLLYGQKNCLGQSERMTNDTLSLICILLLENLHCIKNTVIAY